jgi:hypothetical protein
MGSATDAFMHLTSSSFLLISDEMGEFDEKREIILHECFHYQWIYKNS